MSPYEFSGTSSPQINCPGKHNVPGMINPCHYSICMIQYINVYVCDVHDRDVSMQGDCVSGKIFSGPWKFIQGHVVSGRHITPPLECVAHALECDGMFCGWDVLCIVKSFDVWRYAGGTFCRCTQVIIYLFLHRGCYKKCIFKVRRISEGEIKFENELLSGTKAKLMFCIFRKKHQLQSQKKHLPSAGHSQILQEFSKQVNLPPPLLPCLRFRSYNLQDPCLIVLALYRVSSPLLMVIKIACPPVI